MRGWSSPNAARTSWGRAAASPTGRDATSRPASIDQLQVGDRRARGLEQRQRLGLGVEGVERAAPCPPASRAAPSRPRAAAPSVGARPSREVAPADLEQPHRRRAAVEVAPRRREQAGQQRRAHHLHVLADRVGERPRAAPPNSARRRCSAMKHQVTASLSPRAAAARRTRRSSICARVAVGRATPSARGSGVDGTWSSPWMRTTSSTRSAGPSTSRRQRRDRSTSSPSTAKPSALEDRASARLAARRPRRAPAQRRVEGDALGARPAARRRARPRSPRRRRCRGSARSAASSPSSRNAGSTPRSNRVRASLVEAERLAGARRSARGRNRRSRAARRWSSSATPLCSPPMIPPMSWTPASSAITVISAVERVGLAR